MNECKVYGFEQGSTEWHQVRLGKITGSKAFLLLCKGKDELGLGVAMKKFIYQKAGEFVTNETGDSFKGNAATDRGTALEPVAREAYENETFNVVSEVGFYQLSEFVGCSPDGVVGEHGIIEIKCPLATDFIRYLDKSEISKEYVAQMQFNMFVTGAKWCDFVVFHPDFGEKRLQIIRIKRDERVITIMKDKIKVFESEIKRLLSDFK